MYLWVEKVGLHLPYSFFQVFASHSSYETPFYTVATKRRRWGAEIAQCEDNIESREVFLCWERLKQGLEGKKGGEHMREITVSISFLGIRLQVIRGKISL